MAGTMISGVQSNYLGRKPTLMFTQIIALSGFLFIRFAYGIYMFYIGSFMLGITQGITSAVIPAYIGEINQPQIRKFTGSFIVVAFAIGFSCTKLISVFAFWRDTTSIIMVLPTLGFLLFLLCPETPTWYMLKGKKELAISTMIRLRGDTEVATKEISRIDRNLKIQNQVNSTSSETSYVKQQLNIVTKGTFVRPLLVVTILMTVCWQWTGGAVLTFYLDDILEQFGIPIPTSWAATGLGWYQLVCTLLGVFLSSLIPRRKYYMMSGVFVFLGTAILGAMTTLQRHDFFIVFLNENDIVKWIPFVGLLLYFLGYQLGYISVCFMLMGELLPSNSREIGGVIIIQLNNISFFVAAKSSNFLQEAIGLDGMFWLFTGVAIFSIIFAYLFVPETFGKSLEEMEEHYRKVCYPNKYVHHNGFYCYMNVCFRSLYYSSEEETKTTTNETNVINMAYVEE